MFMFVLSGKNILAENGRSLECRTFPVERETGTSLPVKEQTKLREKHQSETLRNVYVNFSLDGKTVLLNTVIEKWGAKDLYIGSSVSFDNVEKLSASPWNSKKYSTGRAALSPDGKLLVFSSDRRGNYDIYSYGQEEGLPGVKEVFVPENQKL